MFNFAERRFLFFMISAVIIIPGLIAMGYLTVTEGSPVKLSIDFTGGTLLELPFENDLEEQEVRDALEAKGFTDYIVQSLDPEAVVGNPANSRYAVVLKDPDTDIAALNIALQEAEGVGEFWSPDNDDDDPGRTTAQKIDTLTRPATRIDVSFVDEVNEADLSAALAAFELAEFRLLALEPLQAEPDQAGSRFEIIVPTDDEIDMAELNAALLEADGVGELWSPETNDDPDRTAMQTVEVITTATTHIDVSFVDEVNEDDLTAALEAFGLADIIVESLDPHEADQDPAGSRFEITASTNDEIDIAELNAALQEAEGVGEFWSPESADDDPDRTAAQEVDVVTTTATHIDVSFVDEVDGDDLSAALEEFGLADVTVQGLAPFKMEANQAGSTYAIFVPADVEIDVEALNAALLEAEGVGEFWSPETIDDDPDRTAAQEVAEVEAEVLHIDMSFVFTVEPDDLAAALEDFGAANAEITALPTQPKTRWQIRLEELDPDDEAGLIDFLQEPEQLGPIWTPNPNNIDSAILSSHVSATVGREVTQSAVVATAVVAVVVLAFIVFAFRKVEKSFRYGACAIIAMFHDILVTMGIMAILGIFFGWEVDALFLTAILTVVGFSVQDSIVVFDRIRENLPKYRGELYETIVNRSVLETVHRSLATQLNAIFIMFAILLFGGETIKQFIAIMLIGLMSGTYSSIFNAVPMLVAWEKGEIPFVNREAKLKRQKREKELSTN